MGNKKAKRAATKPPNTAVPEAPPTASATTPDLPEATSKGTSAAVRGSANSSRSNSGTSTPVRSLTASSDSSTVPTTPDPSADGNNSKASSKPGSAPPPESKSTPPPEDVVNSAEKVKESGNVAFKAAKYTEALDLYTEAIRLNPNEPSYLTNRAAAYMQLKRFRPALEDCQHAASLQSASPSPKTLLRLARCQFALGSTAAATSTINNVLSTEPKNSQALQLQGKIKALEGHVKNYETAKSRKDWGLARLALDKCLQAIEGEGGEIPADWRIWRVELELARGNWDAANIAANDALRTNANSPDVLVLRGLVLFFSGKLPQALQHAMNALRLDPSCSSAQQLRKRVKDVERLKEEGNVAFKAGKLQEAANKYTEALDRVGGSEEEGKGGQIRATLLSNRATTLLKLSRHEDALRDTNVSLELSPNSFKALRTRARIHLHLEKYDAAIADFKSAIQQAQTEGSATDGDVRALKTELKKAETALKRSKTKDYYKILGVDRDCTDTDIKKAYRRESLKHHPDKGGDEEKFKLVVEAHAVLSDSQRRARYDMGEDEDGNDSGMAGGFSHMDFADLFSQFQTTGMGTGGFSSPYGGFPEGGHSTYSGSGGRRGYHSHTFPF